MTWMYLSNYIPPFYAQPVPEWAASLDFQTKVLEHGFGFEWMLALMVHADRRNIQLPKMTFCQKASEIERQHLPNCNITNYG